MLKSIIHPISQMDIEDTKGSPEYVKSGLVYANSSLVSLLLCYMFVFTWICIYMHALYVHLYLCAKQR